REAVILWGESISLCAAGLLVLLAALAPDNLLSFILPMVFYMAGFGLASAPLNRTTLTATKVQKGSAVAMFYLTMMGSGTLVSLFLSLVKSTIFYSCLVIAITASFSFVLNIIRRNLSCSLT
ncbi:MAG: hypothetical protein KDK50_02845, partial [Chlamydiia bacterium]|nr:hypothetical protein [Chlamydiia bacterium]